jgi:hypothetical protein
MLGFANYKAFNCPVSNSNSHESLMKNLLNPYLEEKDYYA